MRKLTFSFAYAFFCGTILFLSSIVPASATHGQCHISNPEKIFVGEDAQISVTDAQPNQEYTLEFQSTNLVGANIIMVDKGKSSNADGSISFTVGGLSQGSYHFRVAKKSSLRSECTSDRPTTVVLGNQQGVVKPPRVNVKYKCLPNPTTKKGECKRVEDGKDILFDSAEFSDEASCKASCAFNPTLNQDKRPASKPLLCDSDNGIETAIGCIPIRDTNAFAGWFLRWAVGLGGGIAFLLIVTSSFQIMTAGNNPQQLQGGRELLTAAISGLILIIFSVFLLRLIGVQILNIPGFG